MPVGFAMDQVRFISVDAMKCPQVTATVKETPWMLWALWWHCELDLDDDGICDDVDDCVGRWMLQGSAMEDVMWTRMLMGFATSV